MAFPNPIDTDFPAYSGAGSPTTSLTAVTAGDVLIAVVARRGAFDDATALTPGLVAGGAPRPFTAFGAQVNDGTASALVMGYRVATGDEEDLSWGGYNQLHVALYQLPSTADPTTATVLRLDDQGSNSVFSLGTFGGASGHFCAIAYIWNKDFSDTDFYTLGAGWTTDYSDSSDSGRPYVEVGSATPSGSIDATASASISVQWGGFAIDIGATATPLPECDSPVAFDVYSLGDATTPALTYLATLCDAFDKSFRVEKDGTGSGQFSINRASADATAAILGDGDGDVRFVKVRVPGMWGTTAHHGFFLKTGDFRLLDENEEGGETLTFSGNGSLDYLDFAVMLAHSYLTTPFIGMDPFAGLWRLYAAGTGSKPGQILQRIIAETQEAGRPQAPLPLLTDTFDYTNDSNAAAWASSTATNEFAAQINESVLSVTGRLIGTGAITIQMSPEFVLSGYNSFGTDRSSATFAAGKVRFVGGTNIAEGLTRQIRPSRVATHVNVYGESETSVISSLADAATRVTREAGLSSFGTDTTALDAVGDADLAERQLRSESLSVRIALGSDDATGLYLPGPSGSTAGKFWVGDTVTLHTGTGEFDYNNASFPVAAINVIEGPGVAAVTDLEVVVELGSTKIGDAAGGGASNLLSSSPGGGSSAVPPHTHPSSSVISAWKEPVRAASTGNVTVASPGGTLDGVTLAAQDRVLLKDQTTGSQNGPYIWLSATEALLRAPDFTSGTTALGAVVYATEGTVNADRAFVCTTNATITIGTTTLTFVPVALLPHGGGEDTVYPHNAMGATETFDPANGNWHTGTFDANCTFTFTAPRTGKGCTLLLELAQDGTGGWTVTLPASFSNKAALEADQVTTLSTTAFLLAWTRDAGTTWYGQWVGGSGGTESPLTTKGDFWGYSTTDARFPVGTDGQVILADSAVALGVSWQNSGRHAHVVSEPYVGDAAQTVFYLANEAELDTVAAYNPAGARVAITQDATLLDKITFGAAPAAGTGWIDYVPASN